MVLKNVCLHVVEFKLTDNEGYNDFYICGFSNYGSIKRFLDDMRTDNRYVAVACNDITTAIIDVKTWLCGDWDKVDFKQLLFNHFNRVANAFYRKNTICFDIFE